MDFNIWETTKKMFKFYFNENRVLHRRDFQNQSINEQQKQNLNTHLGKHVSG